MTTIRIAATVLDHAAVRDSFAQAAYAGLLPRTQWALAQDLVGRYDDANEDATRAAIASRMLAIGDGDRDADATLRIAA